MTREEFRSRLVAEFGEPFTVSYFDRSGFTPGEKPMLQPWSLIANDKFRREARKFLEIERVVRSKPHPAHLEPGAKPVIFSKRDLERAGYDQ